MRRNELICRQCRFFFNGNGEHSIKRYAFCVNTDIHGSSSLYELFARMNPDNCPEQDFFLKEHNDDVFSECPYKTEQIMENINGHC